MYHRGGDCEMMLLDEDQRSLWGNTTGSFRQLMAHHEPACLGGLPCFIRAEWR